MTFFDLLFTLDAFSYAGPKAERNDLYKLGYMCDACVINTFRKQEGLKRLDIYIN